MKRKFFLPSICLFQFLVCIFLILMCRRLYIKEQFLLADYERSVIPKIVCYGDSLTFGTGGIETEGISFPSILEDRLLKDHLEIPVVNLGIGGDNTVTIAGRAGGIPFHVESFTIPADNTPTEIHFTSSDNQTINLDHALSYGGAGLNDCTICGVTGRITIEKNDDLSRYFFTRTQKGKETFVPQNSEIISAAKLENKDAIFIVWMGENHGYTDNQDLISQFQSIINLQDQNAGKFIVIGPHTGTTSDRLSLETDLTSAFGDKYINLREILNKEGLTLANISPTTEDIKQLELGCVPPSLLYDSVHFNSTRYRVIGNIIYERLCELGYFDDIKTKAEFHSHFWK